VPECDLEIARMSRPCSTSAVEPKRSAVHVSYESDVNEQRLFLYRSLTGWAV